uniref:Secreted protein n=1 Tax=Anguilla anguilla TaxID=7936 RepID=A0A0E9PP23_ANGAN
MMVLLCTLRISCIFVTVNQLRGQLSHCLASAADLRHNCLHCIFSQLTPLHKPTRGQDTGVLRLLDSQCPCNRVMSVNNKLCVLALVDDTKQLCQIWNF